MKKVFALLLTLVMVFSLVACGGSSEAQPSGTSGGSSAATTEKADDQEVYTITLSHQYATTTAFHDMVIWWEEQLETRSNGRIQVEEFPSSQLMPPDQEFTAMLDGRIQANTCNSALMASFDESFSIFEMPFLFGDSYESLENLAVFCRTPEYKELIAGAVEAKGIISYPTYLDGAREMSTVKKPIKTLDDMKGMKIRSTGGRFSEVTAEVFGFSAIAISAAELPTALMQGTVDGQMMNPVYVYQVKSPVNYYTIIPFDYTAVDPINVSKAFYDSLPADLQQLMDEVGDELFDYSIEYITPLLDYSYEMIESDMGIEITELSEDEYNKAAEMAKTVWAAYEEQIPNGSQLIELASSITNGTYKG